MRRDLPELPDDKKLRFMSAFGLAGYDAGVLVAVHVSPETQVQAAATLREAGGMDIERASGRWKQGRWSDFDPLQPMHPA